MFVNHGWLEHAKNVPVHIHYLHGARLQLSVLDDMLVFGNIIVIPTMLRPDILNRINKVHLDINTCKYQGLVVLTGARRNKFDAVILRSFICVRRSRFGMF